MSTLAHIHALLCYNLYDIEEKREVSIICMNIKAKR